MRAKSFGAERRQKQDQQAMVALVILCVVSLLGWVWSGAAPYCWGALMGAWSPLLILSLRYGFRVISGRRRDMWAFIDAGLFILTTVLITIYLYPHDVWHASIMLLCFVATVLGIQRFRFTPLFMLINCLIAGLVLLS